MTKKSALHNTLNRRELLRKGMSALSVAGLSGSVLAPSLFSKAAEAAERNSK